MYVGMNSWKSEDDLGVFLPQRLSTFYLGQQGISWGWNLTKLARITGHQLCRDLSDSTTHFIFSEIIHIRCSTQFLTWVLTQDLFTCDKHITVCVFLPDPKEFF